MGESNLKYLFFGFIAVAIISTVAIYIAENTTRLVPVPRERAFMRIDASDSAYSRCDKLPLSLMVNREAVAEAVSDSSAHDGSRWLNIVYPRFGITVFCSYLQTSGDSLERVLANRRQRVRLNSRSDSPRSVVFADSLSRFTAEVFFAPLENATPVQFIATDSAGFVFTGALFTGGKQNADSIAPVVESVTDDILVMLQNLEL